MIPLVLALAGRVLSPATDVSGSANKQNARAAVRSLLIANLLVSIKAILNLLIISAINQDR
jgi:hypothetical protein